MKIVLVQDDFPPESRGGAGHLVATLALELTRLGHEVTVIASTQTRARAGKDEWRGIPVYRIYARYHERWRAYLSLYNPQTVGEIERILRELRPQVVHVHNVHHYLSYRAIALAKRHAKKVLLTAHDEMLFHYGKFYECVDRSDYKVYWWQLLRRFKRRYNPFRNLIIRHTMHGVPIVALSEAHRDMLADNGFATTVVMNGMDPAGWPADAEQVQAFKKRYALEGKRVVLYAGRSRLKGIECATAMIERVAQRVPEAVLLAAGVEGVRTDHRLPVPWLPIEELKVAYASSDVVVFPSVYFDPFGLVNLEAMASYKPVVATKFGGAPEIVLDGHTGYVVDPRNAEVFADRVATLLEDPLKTKAFGTAGHARLLAHFTAERMAREYLRLYTTEHYDA